MSLKSITPQAARELIESGALLVDIRAADEHAREHIAQALHVPMERLTEQPLSVNDAEAVIFYCRSGNRTKINAQTLAANTSCQAYVLKGGLDAWKKSGLPVIANPSQPLELSRQVHITAGSMIVLGTLLGATVNPWFFAISGFVGAGLVFAGLSGFCGLARVLMKMPWNRRAFTP
ncbi:MAG TPA: rhodanese family protein [Candidimonas sp.]|nr:rhodanese family protein [Candidimonas sp.]